MTPDEWEAMTDEEQADDLRLALARIPAELRAETARSRFRDGCSRRRIHPIQNDVSRLLDLILNSPRRSAVLAAARVVCGLGPSNADRSQALRLLVSVALAPGPRGGGCGRVMKRRCDRILGYADAIEAALAHAPKRRAS